MQAVGCFRVLDHCADFSGNSVNAAHLLIKVYERFVPRRGFCIYISLDD
jgi:hypothetical protein